MGRNLFYFISISCVFVFIVSCSNAKNKQEKEIKESIKYLKSEDSLVRIKARNDIASYKNQAIKPLYEFLSENKDDNLLKEGILCLAEIKTEESASALILFLRKTHNLPNEISDALVRIGKPSVNPLFSAYSYDEHYVREFVIGALNNLINDIPIDYKTTGDIKNFFIKAFKENNLVSVKKMALISLMRFKDDEDVKPVIESALTDKNRAIRELAK
ncbi:MAG: hypothetical protein A2Y97_09215 [Nitrospirae bacterium RBG_13_39_12]|nr:MAG: hypothetical protein A2Y97_09215 [Nitrospirae bacterium RBG_13_39_12]